MAGERGRTQFIDDEVKPAVRKTIPDILARLAALEGMMKGSRNVKPAPVDEQPTPPTPPKEKTLKATLGGDEGIAAIKSSKTLVEAISKVKEVKADKAKK